MSRIVETTKTCPACKGDTNCRTCGGTGMVKDQTASIPSLAPRIECPKCGGSGNCTRCDGQGVVSTS